MKQSYKAHDKICKEKQGVISSLLTRFKKNRLGELLVLDGHISPQVLRQALTDSKAARRPIGYVLLKNKLISPLDLYKTLAEQWALRLTIACAALIVSLGSFGFTNKARAGSGVKDIPVSLQIAQNAAKPINRYPRLFGSEEKRSGNLRPFTKWTSMFQRFEDGMQTHHSQPIVANFKTDLALFDGLPLHRMAVRVNDLINQSQYIIDQDNYGISDYWATPIEFFQNGGDCEDFAIAKYAALRALGVPEERLRLAIVQDLQKDIPHAILIVYTDQGSYVLDNQIKTVMESSDIAHYKPIFSINRDAWWLHTKPTRTPTVVASVQ